MTSVPERPAIDLRSILEPEDAERLTDAMARIVLAAARVRAERAAAANPEPPAPKPKRTRRARPSKLAKWEAAWQAEQADAEAES